MHGFQLLSWLLLEIMAIAMYCNLRPPDAAPDPVILRFDWDGHTQFEVSQGRD